MNSNIEFVQFTDVRFELPSQPSGLIPEVKGNAFNTFKFVVLITIVGIILTAIILIVFRSENDGKEELDI